MGVAAALAGCGDDEGDSPVAVVDHSVHPVAAMEVLPPVATVINGDSVVFAVALECGCGEPVMRGVAWVVDDPEVAVLHQDGSLHARAPGLATVRAVVEGREATAHVVVEPRGTLVGEAGGVARSADGRARVEFPNGALHRSMDIVVEPTTSPDAAAVPGTVHRFEPGGVHFLRPARIVLEFDRAALPGDVHPSGLRLHQWTADGWMEVPGSGPTEPGDGVAGATEHFSIFGLVPVRAAVEVVQVSPASVSLAIGQEQVLDVEIVDAHGSPVFDRTVTWSSSDPSVVTVAAGTLRALAVGEAVVTARSEDVTGQVAVHVVEPASTVRLEPASLTVYLGDPVPLRARVFDALGIEIGRELSWSTDAPGVVRVYGPGSASGPGTVRAVGGGRAVVTVALADQPDVRAESEIVVLWPPATLELHAPAAEVPVGSSIEFVAEARDADGAVVPATITWRSETPSILDVGASGTVRAVAAGAGVVSARAGGITATRALRVLGPPWALSIEADSEPSLPVGGELALTARVTDVAGAVLAVPVEWSLVDEQVASLRVVPGSAGRALLTGLHQGVVVVGASAAGLSASLEVTVVRDHGGGGGGGGGGSGAGGGQGGGGGHEEGLGNNLSWPVVFAEGIGLTGVPVGSDTGLRPRPEEGWTVDDSPWWSPANVPDNGTSYYEQQGLNTWRATWIDGAGDGAQRTIVHWGDNLTHHTWNTHSVIRIEHTLTALDRPSSPGFAMTWLSGQGPTEMQGTDGTRVDEVPTVFSVMPELVLQKLDDETREVVHEIVVGGIADGLGRDGPGYYSAEVNVAGRVIYGYNWFVRDESLPTGVHRYGWWRIVFRLRDQAIVGGVPVARNTSLDLCGNVSEGEEEALTYTPVLDPSTNTSSLVIWIDSAGGGSGGGGGGGGGSGGGGSGGGGSGSGSGGGCGSH